MLEFRKDFAKELIYNPYLEQTVETVAEEYLQQANVDDHTLCTLPPKHTFLGPIMVAAIKKYQQRKCIGCPRRVRTYCICSPGVYRCTSCHVLHVLDEYKPKSSEG